MFFEYAITESRRGRRGIKRDGARDVASGGRAVDSLPFCICEVAFAFVVHCAGAISVAVADIISCCNTIIKQNRFLEIKIQTKFEFYLFLALVATLAPSATNCRPTSETLPARPHVASQRQLAVAHEPMCNDPI